VTITRISLIIKPRVRRINVVNNALLSGTRSQRLALKQLAQIVFPSTYRNSIRTFCCYTKSFHYKPCLFVIPGKKYFYRHLSNWGRESFTENTEATGIQKYISRKYIVIQELQKKICFIFSHSVKLYPRQLSWQKRWKSWKIVSLLNLVHPNQDYRTAILICRVCDLSDFWRMAIVSSCSSKIFPDTWDRLRNPCKPQVSTRSSPESRVAILGIDSRGTRRDSPPIPRNNARLGCVHR